MSQAAQPLSYYSDTPAVIRAVCGIGAVYFAIKAYLLLHLAVLEGGGWGYAPSTAVFTILAGLGIGYAILAPEHTVHLDPVARTVDVFTTIRGRSTGPTYSFDDVQEVRVGPVTDKYGHVRGYRVLLSLRNRWLPLTLISYPSARDATIDGDKVRQLIFGDTPPAPDA
jgi:hypothetical protein